MLQKRKPLRVSVFDPWARHVGKLVPRRLRSQWTTLPMSRSSPSSCASVIVPNRCVSPFRSTESTIGKYFKVFSLIQIALRRTLVLSLKLPR